VVHHPINFILSAEEFSLQHKTIDPILSLTTVIDGSDFVGVKSSLTGEDLS